MSLIIAVACPVLPEHKRRDDVKLVAAAIAQDSRGTALSCAPKLTVIGIRTRLFCLMMQQGIYLDVVS